MLTFSFRKEKDKTKRKNSREAFLYQQTVGFAQTALIKRIFKMNIKCLPLSCNCYIVSDCDGNAVLFDPCERGEEIYAYIKEQGLNLSAVIITHAHFDHIYGLDGIVNSAKDDGKEIPVYIHTADAPAMRSREKNLSSPLFRTPYEYTGTLNELSDGDRVTVGNLNFRVMLASGHTVGSACYINDEEKIIFAGDVLFEGSIGRTDFPGGDMGKMRESLTKLMELDDSFRVYSGHGESTTIGDERNWNPYIGG